MLSFKETTSVTLPKIKKPLSKEALIWHQSLQPAKVVKEYGSISHLDVNPTNNELLVSSSSRICIYNINNMDIKKSYQSNTSHSVYWAAFRISDYRLFTSSTEDGKVNIYDTDNSKSIRTLGFNTPSGHVASVRCSQFAEYSKVVSFSDDKHIKLWDISDGSMVQDIGSDDIKQITAHTDYVRCGCVVNMGPFLIASGSYDHMVKVWDTRENSLKPVNKINLNHPVEAITSKGSFLAIAASKTIKIFDLIAGKICNTLPNVHSKTITCLKFHENSLLSGSLDGQINIFNEYFSPVTTLSYVPSQLLTIGSSQKALVVGTVDGLVIGKTFKAKDLSAAKSLPEKNLKLKNMRYFRITRDNSSYLPEGTLLVMNPKDKPTTIPQHDKKLKKYDHSKALDLTLHRSRSKPHIVVSMMQELNRRGALRAALAGRNIDGVKYIMKFLIDYVRDPRFSRILVDVAIMFCEIYGSKVSESIPLQNLFKSLFSKVSLEVSLMKTMMMIEGEIELILHNSVSSLTSSSSSSPPHPKLLSPENV